MKKKADAILVSDLHLTDTFPISRIDNYQNAQEQKLDFLCKLSEQNNKCPILCAGDTFDHWKASPWLSNWVFRFLPSNFVTVPGNHDLPGHSIEMYFKSALALQDTINPFMKVLKNDTVIIGDLCIAGIPFGEIKNFEETSVPEKSTSTSNILLLHELIWKKEKPNWAENTYTAKEIIRKFNKKFDLIVTGDNHQSFVIEYKNTILVNPGSMMRRTVEQAGFQPKCYLYYRKRNIVKAIDFPIQEGVHNIEYLGKEKEKDKRIAAYIEHMKGGWEIGLSLEENIKAFFLKNKTPKKVRRLIWQAMETKN